MIVSYFAGQKKRSARKFLEILEVYERGSGQKINKDKTNIFFSSNTQHDLQDQIQHLLGVPAIRQYEKYLGLLALVGQARKQSFFYLKERVWRKVGRKNIFLNQLRRFSLN